MEQAEQQINTINEQPTGETQQVAKQSSKTMLYGGIMVALFFAFAIPLYLLLIKGYTKQNNVNNEIVLQNAVEENLPVTITPITIKTEADLQKAEKDLDNLDAKSLEGVLGQFDAFKNDLSQ